VCTTFKKFKVLIEQQEKLKKRKTKNKAQYQVILSLILLPVST